MTEYDPAAIEGRWQAEWEASGLATAPEKPGRKYYQLEMFAYPSGDIHLGHFRNYSIGDALARFRMMQGYDVMHPFGWDAFGLPAENAAIKRDLHPRDWTLNNIEVSRGTLRKMGIAYDWSREVTTCLPDYYRWSQWLFLLMHDRGLAYRAKSFVNWCPGCNTVIANEQVIDGACERCDSAVDKKDLEQWSLRITEYAQRLLDGLDELDGWPSSLKKRQQDWIGRSEGCEIAFEVEGDDFDEPVRVFTTRPDTLYGVTFMAVAPESPLAARLAAGTGQEAAVAAYAKAALRHTDVERSKEDREKDGVFTGRYAVHPLSGERVQLWVADYVLGGYGTGVVMGVPAHDQRDFEFARKYDIPLRVVIQPEGEALDEATMEAAFTDVGLMVNSGPFDGTNSSAGIAAVAAHCAEKGLGGPHVQFRLRDWLISRQRYWGTPIPMVHCAACGVVPVPASDLPIELPDVTNFLPKGRSPLADVPEFVNTTCPKCGGAAERDVDTMDTFICSSWYHLRYADAQNDAAIFDREAVHRWLPIDLYVGGAEHACGHLIFFRFVTMVLHDAGYLDFEEPATRLFNHGMLLDATGEKMSKSKGNLVSPQEMMAKYGVDSSRVGMFFFAPSGDEIRWDENVVAGARRFLRRVHDAVVGSVEHVAAEGTAFEPDALSPAVKEFHRRLHVAIGRATDALESDLAFNTAIAKAMEAMNAFGDVDPAGASDADRAAMGWSLRRLVLILAPFAPHLGEELHAALGGEGSVFRAGWPVYDAAMTVTDTVEIPVQVNGKLRGRVEVPAEASRDEIEAAARADERIVEWLAGKSERKVVVVPGRLVNFVVG